MSRIRLSPSDAAGLLALTGLAVGVYLVHGMGWALIVVSILVLVYLVVPDQRPGGPTP